MAEPPTTDPLLWIAKLDKRGRRAEKAVIDAAHRIWARVLYYVRKTILWNLRSPKVSRFI